MRILVTGATGFIGSNLCRALVEQGHLVRGLQRASSPVDAIADLSLERVVGDVLDPESIDRAVHGVQVVFHTAAQMRQWSDPDQARASHVLGTRNVLHAARRAGVARVIHTSSVAALGVPDPVEDPRQARLMDESHAWNYNGRLWPYGYAKHLAELEVQRAAAAGMEAVIVNPTWVVGAGDVHRLRTSPVWYAARGRIPVSLPGGLNVVHIRDVTAGHLAAMVRGRSGERYILGGENLTLTQILQQACVRSGRRPPRWQLPAGLVRRGVRVLSAAFRASSLPIGSEILRLVGRYFYYDMRKARDELCLPAPLGFAAAIDDALAWYRQLGER